MAKKIILILALVMVVAAGLVPNASASSNYFTFEFSLVSIKVDVQNSNDNLFGYDNWYQWLYKVEAVENNGNDKRGLSHFTIGLEDCFKGDLLKTIASTAGANGIAPNDGNLSGLTGNLFRTYTITTGKDGSSGVYGIKWDLVSGKFEKAGDYDYFWFSAPTKDSIDNLSLVKRGTAKIKDSLPTPDCPDGKCTCDEEDDCHPRCDDCNAVPEPMTLSLLGAGLAGIAVRRRK